jgi:hypothetical protein
MNKKTHIVIPIGVSQPGTPVLSLLEKSVGSILNQTSKEFILTVASDDNIPDTHKKFLEDAGVQVKWFPPASFFRRGGIWKKITETWKDSDTKYLSFLHYDDFWDIKKLELQVQAMEEKNLSTSWSEVYVIDGESRVVSGDCATFQHFTKENAGFTSTAWAHSVITRRDTFFESGIVEHQDRWSPLFEMLYKVYLHKQGNGEKVAGSRFFWRNHEMNMTNSIFVDPALKPIMEEQRVIGEYPSDNVDRDYNAMREQMNQIINEIRNA